MPLNHYVTPRPLRAPRQPLLPRRHDLRRRPRLGLQREGTPRRSRDRFVERGGNFIDNRQRLHPRPLREDHRRPPRQGPEQARPGLVLATKFTSNLYPRRPQRRRLEPQGDRRPVRAVVAPPPDGLHRSVLAARVGSLDAHRGDDGRAPRPRHEPARSATSASPTPPRGRSRRPTCSPPSAVSPPFVALQIEYSLLERTVEGELIPMAQELGLGVHPPGRPSRGGALTGKYKRADRGQPQARPRRVPHGRARRRPDVRHRRRSRAHRRQARQHARARRARVGAGPARGRLHHHRRPHARPARRQPRRARPAALDRGHRGARQALRPDAPLPRPVPGDGRDVQSTAAPP